jgi:hypothetical protein
VAGTVGFGFVVGDVVEELVGGVELFVYVTVKGAPRVDPALFVASACK